MPDSPFFFHPMSNVPNVPGVVWLTMRKIVCPFTKELLEDLYLNQKLTDKEIDDLVKFLESLTSSETFTSPKLPM